MAKAQKNVSRSFLADFKQPVFSTVIKDETWLLTYSSGKNVKQVSVSIKIGNRLHALSKTLEIPESPNLKLKVSEASLHRKYRQVIVYSVT